MATYAGRYSEDLQDRYGNGFANAKVAVQTLVGGAVTLYADRIKTAYVPATGLAANETKADDKGNLRFFADPGNYQIVVTPSGGTALAAIPVSVYPDPLEPSSGGPPSGGAGGVLSGSYPNPGFAVDMAEQSELDAHTSDTANPHAVTKTQVGLANADNTSDANKPVSTAQATAIGLVQTDVDTHEARTDNPHAVTKTQVGLSNADNTSDANKPVSTAQATADALAVPKSLYDANSILKADSDNTPIVLTVAASQIIGRKATGSIVAMTMAELAEMLDATNALAGTLFDRPITGSWYVPLGVPGTAAATSNVYAGCWLFVPVDTSVDRIGCEVTTNGNVGDTARLSLYKKVRGSATLTQVLAETADLDCSTPGQKEATIALTLTPGRYAAMVRFPVKVGAVAIRYRVSNATAGNWLMGSYPMDTTELLTDPRPGIGSGQITEAQTGAFPSTLTLKLGTRSHAPLIYLRVA